MIAHSINTLMAADAVLALALAENARTLHQTASHARPGNSCSMANALIVVHSW